MRYVVTGGAGFIGSHLSDALVRQGHEVVIVDDLSSSRKENIVQLLSNKRVSFIEGSIVDLDLLLESFKGADGIFHQAALVSVQKSIEHPVRNHEVNVTGTFNVLLAARNNSVRKVVCASSAAVYGNLPGLPKREDMPTDPLSPYAAAKLMDEYYASVFSRLYGMETVSLRYFNVYGPRQDPASEYAAVIPKFIDRVKNGQPPIIYGDGDQTRDFVFVEDVVQANVKAMESTAQGAFNVASGKETSVNELAAVLCEIFAFSSPPLYVPERLGEVEYSVADITKVKNGFGFEPKFRLRNGLAEMMLP